MQIFLLVVVMFTTAGPVMRTVPVETQAACEQMGAPGAANEALFGKKIELQAEPAPAPPTSVLILYAEAHCNVFTKKDSA